MCQELVSNFNTVNKAKMAEETLLRFQLLDDDQMQDLLTARTPKRVHEIIHNFFFQNRSSRPIVSSSAKILPVEIAHVPITAISYRSAMHWPLRTHAKLVNVLITRDSN